MTEVERRKQKFYEVVEKNPKAQARLELIHEMSSKEMSNMEIAKQLGLHELVVRDYLSYEPRY